MMLSSDQGATDVLFARPDGGDRAGFRLLRDAIVLDVDGYEAPVLSDDGRHLAFRGNAYVQSLDVFEFPSLRSVLRTTLGEPSPGFPYPTEWLEEQARWSRHAMVFGPSGSLLVGTPRGVIVEIDLDADRVVEHPVTTAPVSALATLSTGELVLADRSGQVHVRPAPGVGEHDRPARREAARARAEEFLATSTELPDDADLDEDLLRHDGERTWSAADLDRVTDAADDDPTWLRLRAGINTYFAQGQAGHSPG